MQNIGFVKVKLLLCLTCSLP